MKKYQVLTVVHSYFSISIVPDNAIYNDFQDALAHVHKMIDTFVKNGEEAVYKGKISSTDEIFAIYREVAGGEYTEVYIYELDVR